MDTRNQLSTRPHERGAAKLTTIAIIAIVVLLALGAWFLIIKPHQELVMADSGGQPSTPVTASTKAAPPPPADISALDVNQLLAEARSAMNEQRYLAPAGNNAFEFYLRALAKDPGNKVATDALRETFPFATNSAEQAINANNFAEAQREIDLLAKADPTNFTLTILRSKLDAQRNTQDKQQQLAADQLKAQQLAAQKAAADKAAADQLAVEQQKKAELAAEQQKLHKTREAQQTPTSNGGAGTASATTGNSAATGETTDAVLLKSAPVHYPMMARNRRLEGWVVVSFTVEPNGRTSQVTVVDAQPRHVFDRAAIEAVSHYEFKPAMRNGVAVASIKQQKIAFKL